MQTADVVGCVSRINVNDQYDADGERLAPANKETKTPTKEETDTAQTNTWLSTAKLSIKKRQEKKREKSSEIDGLVGVSVAEFQVQPSSLINEEEKEEENLCY